MRVSATYRNHGFTIMELLVVIAIIALVAGLVVGLAGVAGENSKTKRTQVELEKIKSLIDAYKSKVGVYPPDNPNANNAGINSLLYELAGAVRDHSTDPNPTYITPFGNITSNELWSTYGINGIYNAADNGADDAKIFRVLKDVHRDQTNLVAGHLSLAMPVDGPNGRPNPWKYRTGANAVHNPDTYDLWVEIVVRGKSNTIGNWKN